MKIKMLLGLAGANFSLAPGDIPPDGQFTEKEAERLVDAGLAEWVKDGESSEVTLRLALDNENLLKEMAELRTLATRLEESEARIVVLVGENDALQRRAEDAEKSLAEAAERGGALEGRIAELEKALGDVAADQGKKSKSGAG
ncbi:hypothetical protein AGRO_2665 [Agrobacterium sp. ATCC 31749]|uniref:hypothetical protein n=1 Tax=unclassified Agrobacterium TaxID=2632611 RepID=UPI00020DBDD2|nr:MULTISPECIES: hypothetical protein [unclassified Agrobacterium]EGL64456.1 hypothetical protein AGRO_2665 [Agrobacterium sp. ATCC 31749]QKW95832.1 hypothetical protein GSF67_01180 [Agrobacterium sp. CGMCC 11546]